MSEERYISMKEAAEIAGLTIQAVSVAAKRGLIGTRIAGHWVFTRAEMEIYRDKPKSKGGRPKSESPIRMPLVAA